ncbi:MAG: hypothetical protein Q9224_006045, partial [Gallowayella concinna]
SLVRSDVVDLFAASFGHVRAFVGCQKAGASHRAQVITRKKSALAAELSGDNDELTTSVSYRDPRRGSEGRVPSTPVKTNGGAVDARIHNNS